MKDVKWSEPVIIALQNGIPRKFQSVYDAYDFLLHEWAVPLGKLYHDAVDHCKATLYSGGCGERAREAFVSVSKAENCLWVEK